MRRASFALYIIVALVCLMAAGLGVVALKNIESEKAVSALKDEDYTTALQKFRLLAWFGNGDAQFFLGRMYALGQGVDKNDAEAIRHFKRVPGSNQPAQSELAIGQEYLDGVERTGPNAAEARKWLRRAADEGNEVARTLLETMESTTKPE